MMESSYYKRERYDRMKKTALYIRVSTDAQAEEGYSIDAQKEKLLAACTINGWDNHELYIDGGWSGSNIDRPEMQHMIADIKGGKLERCVVYKLDRLSRSQKDVLYIIEDLFDPYGVDFVSLTEQLDTGTPMGRAMIGILAAFAQLERENIRMRTRMGMRERVKEGYWMGGGRIPYGYDYDSKQGILVPNKDAEKVRMIYKLYIDGQSPQKIANTLGLKYERLVMQILQRKSNIGIIQYNGEEYKGRHEPIIDEATYYKAMQEMEERSKKKVNYTENLLTGLVYCGKCGAKMRYQKWSTKGHKLVCYSQQTSKPYLVKNPDCDQTRLWAKDVEEIVVDHILNLKMDVSNKSSDSTNAPSTLEMLEARAANVSKKIRRLYDLYADSADDLLLDTIKENQKELESIKAQIENEVRGKALSDKRAAIYEKLENLKDMWEYMTLDEKKEILRLIIRRVVITDERINIELEF